jgi:hypothetical protein
MNWIKSHKILAGIIAVVILIVIAGLAGGNDKKKTENNTPSPTPTTTQQTNSQPTQAQSAVPKYELVGEYGNGGKAYVISPTDATQEKLTLIGKDLNKRFGSDSFARIGIYTDRAQAQIIVNNPADAANLEGAAADAYDKAYVAQFNVNKSTRLKTYVIYLNGSSKEVKL